MKQSEQAPTKAMTTLDDLKRAISYATTDVDDFDSDAARERARGEAWRTAFEWHVQLIERHAALSETVGAHLTDWIAIDREEEEGKALIREKLR